MITDSKFIKKPNLPSSDVTACIIGKGNTELMQELKELGILSIETESEPLADKEISRHADMQVFHSGGGRFIVSPAQNTLKGELQKLGGNVIVAEKSIHSPYPFDCGLNCAAIDKLYIGKKEAISDEIKTFADKNGINILDVKQGYAKCSICIVSENAIITEDSGITRLLNNSQVEVLKVEPGFAALSEKHFGFLGGACGKVGKDKLYFNGDISSHPDYNAIYDFCGYYGVKLIFNSNRKLTDIGGIIPICEKI